MTPLLTIEQMWLAMHRGEETRVCFKKKPPICAGSVGESGVGRLLVQHSAAFQVAGIEGKKYRCFGNWRNEAALQKKWVLFRCTDIVAYLRRLLGLLYVAYMSASAIQTMNGKKEKKLPPSDAPVLSHDVSRTVL